MNIKELLMIRLKELVQTIQGLESLTIVGSHGNPEKELEKVNDFDLLFIFDVFDKDRFNELNAKLSDLIKEFDKPEHAVWSEFRIGPVKPSCPRSAAMCTMLHVLFFDIESFKQYQQNAPFASLDWAKFKAIYGKNLNELFTFQIPNREQLLHAPRHSFDFYEKMLDDKVYILIKLDVKNGEIARETQTYQIPQEQLVDLFSDILKKLVLNTVMVEKRVNQEWTDDELVETFLMLFPQLAYLKFEFQEIISLKKRKRRGEILEKNIMEYEEMTRNLIKKLKSIIDL